MRKFKYIENIQFPIYDWNSIYGTINGSFEIQRIIDSKIIDELVESKEFNISHLRKNGDKIRCGNCFLINNNENWPSRHKEAEDRFKEYIIIDFLNKKYIKNQRKIFFLSNL